MINIRVLKLEASGMSCSGPNCKHNPELFYCFFGHIYHILQGSTVAEVYLSNAYESSIVEYYCRDCIDDLYADIKSKLDSKLWIFH